MRERKPNKMLLGKSAQITRSATPLFTVRQYWFS